MAEVPAAGGGARVEPAAAPICSQATWFGRCAVVFHSLQQRLKEGSSGAQLPVPELCAASRLMAESYGFMFGPKGMVTGVLNKDVEDNTGGFERASARLCASAPGSMGDPVTVEAVLEVECVLRGAARC